MKYPFWSAADAKVNSSAKAGAGNPAGNVFAPGEADTCFQGSSSHSRYRGQRSGTAVSARGPYNLRVARSL